MLTMNSKYGSRSYGHSAKSNKSNVKFDQVLSSESKPSTAKVSMAAVHRWGNTSFTSIRKTNANGSVEIKPSEEPTQSKKKKKRVSSPIPEPVVEPVSSMDPFDFEPANGSAARKDPFDDLNSGISVGNNFVKPSEEPPPKRNKFFKSRNLFDSLKNGPSYNNERLNYSDGVVNNSSVKKEQPDHSTDYIETSNREYSSTISQNKDSNELKLTLRLKKEPPVVIPETPAVEKTDIENKKSSDDLNVGVDDVSSCHSSTILSSFTGNSDSQELVESSSSVEDLVQMAIPKVNPSQGKSTTSSQSSSSRPAKKFFVNRQSKSSNSPSKSPSKALFKMKLWEQEDFDNEEKSEHSSQPSVLSDNFSAEFDDVAVPPLRRNMSAPARAGHDAVMSVHCERSQKPLYTVVRNVKQAHQCHESGETQEFNDDIDYLIDGLEKYNSTGTRCLSALSLATKCMIPSFRMHLRAHGTIPKLFSALQDSPSDPNVAFCSATLMFVLSQDRLNMDLDSSMLELMLQLLETTTQIDIRNSGISYKELQKNKEKVRSVCEQMQAKSHAKQLNLDHITTGELAMETLLTLTSKRAGEWFKEEIRELGGLDHIIKTVSVCTSVFESGQVPSMALDASVLEKIGKVSRCFRVLENVTHQNVENQTYLISVNDSSLVKCLIRLLHACDKLFPLNNVSDIDDISSNASHPGVILFNCLQSTLRVLVNLTNNNASTSRKIGCVPGVIDLGLNCVLQLPKYVPADKKFDLRVLSLGMLINLMESSEDNRRLLMDTETVISSFDGDELKAPAMEALVQLFTEKFEEARQSEEQTDKLLGDTEKQCEANAAEGSENASSQQSSTTVDDIEETLMKALKKAGKHMEHSIVGAYTALLIGFVIQNNTEYTDIVREYLPEGDYKLMAKLLRTLYNFMILTVAPGNTGVKTVKQILDVLDAS